MRVLALDLGTKCGYAIRFDQGFFGGTESGTWDLAPKKKLEGGGMRYVRLRRHLEAEAKRGLDLVVFEDVKRHAGTMAAHVYGGCKAIVEALCEEHRIPYTSTGVGTIKKHATGKGNASKDAMIEAARARGWKPADDNEADALWILDHAWEELKG